MSCKTCGTPLEYSGSGRPPTYCSRRCKRQAARQRLRFGPFRPRVSAPREPVSAPVSTPVVAPEPEPLTRTEAEAILGRPLANGLTFDEYRDLVGTNLGGGLGAGGVPRKVDLT
jgi:hypothetical protein